MGAKNMHGRTGILAPWDTIKALWCSDEKTAKEIGTMFNVNPKTIETRAAREGWREIRARVREQKIAQIRRGGPATVLTPNMGPNLPPQLLESKTPKAISEPKKSAPKTEQGEGFAPSRELATEVKKASNEETLQRALDICDSTKFRERVIAINDSALRVLERNLPSNVNEVDRFAEALTKVERIGARTYGYDRETDRPVINIGVLTSGQEYEQD